MIKQDNGTGSGFNIKKYIREETLGGFLLIFVTIIALVWANSGYYGLYHHIWHEIRPGFTIGDFELKFSLQHWINDGLMVIFFFMAGLCE
jgi:NhaA family Na+:H+ antiporter